MATLPGHRDVLAVNADGAQIRFSAAADKTSNLSLAKIVGEQTRAIAIRGAGASPGADVDVRGEQSEQPAGQPHLLVVNLHTQSDLVIAVNVQTVSFQ